MGLLFTFGRRRGCDVFTAFQRQRHSEQENDNG
jgi:hypothetical protein